MKIARLKELVGAYGADAARWPAAERAAAQQLLSMSDEARAVVVAQRRLDDALLRSRTAAPADALLARIVEHATAQPQLRIASAAEPRRSFSFDFGFGQLWPRAAGLVACALLGFFVGWSGMIDIPTSDAGELGISALVSDDSPFDGAGW